MAELDNLIRPWSKGVVPKSTNFKDEDKANKI